MPKRAVSFADDIETRVFKRDKREIEDGILDIPMEEDVVKERPGNADVSGFFCEKTREKSKKIDIFQKKIEKIYFFDIFPGRRRGKKEIPHIRVR